MNILPFPNDREVPERELTPDQQWEEIVRLKNEVEALLRRIEEFGRKKHRAQNFLRYRFNVASHTELTIGQMRQAIPMLRDTVEKCEVFYDRMATISQVFDTEVVGRGAPWTPWIARRVGRRKLHRPGIQRDWEQLAQQLEKELGEASDKAGR